VSGSLALDSYRLLGRSGLRVAPLSLGTMTFGCEWGYGADQEQSRLMFDTYVDKGGNFIDTANVYTDGTAEKFIGIFAKGKRDRLVIATKYTLTMRTQDPNSCGNHRKSMVRSVETSLARMCTDYIDLLYLHAWDATTPVEEILRALDDLVRAGKVLYVGISDTVAWQIARMQTMADLRGWTPLIALQIEYNLIQRTVERELIPMAAELGLGVIPWGPLAGGVLTGKYTSTDLRSAVAVQNARKTDVLATGALSERGLAIADCVRSVARKLGKTPSQVALAWTLLNPAIASPIVGARTLEQLNENLSALEVQLSQEDRTELDACSAIDPGFPHNLLALMIAEGYMFGGLKIARRGPSDYR
jgi:aryl-alcohol dehydrogenase-like predicted oxidoreductase